MGSWTVAIACSEWNLDLAQHKKDNAVPTFVQIARAITEDIRRGRLRAGDALPGTRTLATSLGIHRNTVLAAYRELFAEGWIASEKARGTFVSVEIPEAQPRRFSTKAAVAREVASRAGYDVPDAIRPGDGRL